MKKLIIPILITLIFINGCSLSSNEANLKTIYSKIYSIDIKNLPEYDKISQKKLYDKLNIKSYFTDKGYDELLKNDPYIFTIVQAELNNSSIEMTNVENTFSGNNCTSIIDTVYTKDATVKVHTIQIKFKNGKIDSFK